MKNYAYVVCALSILALIAALIMSFFGSAPCFLCVYARWVFAGLAFTSFLFAKAIQPRVPKRGSTFLYVTCLLLCLSGLGLSLTHSGFERGWVHLKMACAQSITKNNEVTTIEQLRHSISEKETAHCDRVEWSLLGLSLPNYNVLLFLFLLLGFMIYGKPRKK